MTRVLRWDKISEATTLPELVRILNRRVIDVEFGATGSSDADPGGVPDCILWNRANDLLLTHADGDTVDNWYDASENANHGTAGPTPPTFATNVFGNSMPGVHFDAHAYISYVVGFFTGLTAAEVFVVMKRDVSPPPNSGARGFWYFSNEPSNPAQVPTDTGVIWDGFGSTVLKNTGVTWTGGTSAHIYNVSSGAGAWTNRLDNVQLYTTATNTVGFNVTWARLGADFSGGTSPTYYYVGYFAELIVFDRVLTTIERDTVYNYLSAKYAI